MGVRKRDGRGDLTVPFFIVKLVVSTTTRMKPTILLERFPYRFLETEDRGWIEKYDERTRRYTHMYELDCELQMLTCIEDEQYVRWLDPAGVPCYREQRGDVVKHPSRHYVHLQA